MVKTVSPLKQPKLAKKGYGAGTVCDDITFNGQPWFWQSPDTVGENLTKHT